MSSTERGTFAGISTFSPPVVKATSSSELVGGMRLCLRSDFLLPFVELLAEPLFLFFFFFEDPFLAPPVSGWSELAFDFVSHTSDTSLHTRDVPSLTSSPPPLTHDVPSLTLDVPSLTPSPLTLDIPSLTPPPPTLDIPSHTLDLSPSHETACLVFTLL